MKKYFFAILLLLLVSLSCKEQANMPVSIGKINSVIVVLRNGVSQTPASKTLDSILTQEIYGMPQSESLFDVAHVTEANLTDLLKKNRNIIYLIISDTVKKDGIFMSEDVFATPQTILFIRSSHPDSAKKLIEKSENLIINTLKNTEYRRIYEIMSKSPAVDIKKKINENFGIDLQLINLFFEAKSTKDFMWLRLETNNYSQGLILMKEPLISENQFNPSHIRPWIDSTLKLHIPGQFEGTYMKIDDSFIKLKIDRVVINDIERIVFTGLWGVQGDFMGGPFRSHTFLSKDKTHLITVYAYVYYPSEEKRNLMMDLEAILYSIKFV
ncbi:MAG: DUF4837 family protein [Bacteroidales bacterium]|jgi:hypothetical protein|nr:DUF4837 family protein [Bacteroidales bacterium]MDI9575369.1 DUF4837 family protein [Bacteroidota bacterium]MDD2593646.1 DUF4837 family protein [Bacteroidales bacterium]MDD3754878.1 DUF4837 family protein [Bacteroidales bacterium]MDY0400082.1 DUF4837 family protein [Bacteroidales bacterium]